MDVPGKASTIALVDIIEPPIVRLDDGSVVQVSTVEHAIKVGPRTQKILYLGDILIGYGDFLENNAHLLPSSYVEEIWALQLQSKLLTRSSPSQLSAVISERLIQLSKEPFTTLPTAEEAFEISEKINIPLHPKYSFYWDFVSIDEVLLLREKICKEQQETRRNNTSSYPCRLLNDSPKLKDILERLGVIHSVKNEGKIIEIDNMDQAYSLTKLLTSEPTIPTALRLSSSLSVNNIVETKDAIEFVSKISGFEIMPKFASSISVRVGRPEKAPNAR